jgi:transcriptional regulator with XRE-family HTH domain
MANQLLITARKRRSWTQAELSERIGADESSVVRWEKGTLPQRYYRQQLCELFGLSEEELGFVQAHAVWEDAPAMPERVSPHDLPLPTCPHLVGREADLAYLRQRLKEGDSMVLTGLPGVGKTALASVLVHEESIQAAFAGVLWASLGSAPDLFSHFVRWGKLLGLSDRQTTHLDSMEKWQCALRAAMGHRRFLLVIDDVWEVTDLNRLSVGGRGCVFLVTTRHHRLAMESPYREYMVHELDPLQAFQFLQRLVPLAGETEAHRSERLVLTVGGLPLALVIAGRYLRQQAYSGSLHRQRLRDALQHLERAEVRFHLGLVSSSFDGGADSSVSLFSQIHRSTRVLGEQARRVLAALAIFPPKPSSFPEEAACMVAESALEILEELVDNGLVERAGASRYMLHPVIADYAGLHLDQGAVGTLSERLMMYVLDFLEAHRFDDRILALEIPMILAALEVTRAFGKQTELIHAVQLFAPFLWKMAIPLHQALSQAGGKQNMPAASHLPRAIAALIDHLEHSHEQAGMTPLLSGIALARLSHLSLSESQDRGEICCSETEQTDAPPGKIIKQ